MKAKNNNNEEAIIGNSLSKINDGSRRFTEKQIKRNKKTKNLCKHPSRDEFWDDESSGFENFVRMIEFLTNELYESFADNDFSSREVKLEKPNWNDLSTIDVYEWNYLATGMIMEVAQGDHKFYRMIAGEDDGPFHLMTYCLRNRDGSFFNRDQ